MLTVDELKAIREREPDAWAVDCPLRHEFDALVFPSIEEADTQAMLFNDDLPIGEPDQYKPVPLYRSGEDVPRLLADLNECREEAERHKNNWLGVCDELKDVRATLERVRAALTDEATDKWLECHVYNRDRWAVELFIEDLRSLLEEQP